MNENRFREKTNKAKRHIDSFIPPAPLRPPRKRRNYKPWEVDMTLCIAAFGAERQRNKASIIAAFDQRIENDIAGSNSELKFLRLNASWHAMIAGPVSQATELCNLYREHLKAINDLTKENAIERLRVPPRELRRRLADEVTQQYFCMSHQEFLEHGRSSVSDEMYRHVETLIGSQRIEAELILMGCIGGEAHIYTCIAGQIERATAFATIGSGSTIAD